MQCSTHYLKLIFHHFFHKSQASSTKCELNHILIFPNKNVDRKKRSVCTNTWFSWRLSLQKQSKSSGQNSNIYFVCIFFSSLSQSQNVWFDVKLISGLFFRGTIRLVGRCDQHRLVEKKKSSCHQNLIIPNYCEWIFQYKVSEKKFGLYSKHENSMVCSIWPKI